MQVQTRHFVINGTTLTKMPTGVTRDRLTYIKITKFAANAKLQLYTNQTGTGDPFIEIEASTANNVRDMGYFGLANSEGGFSAKFSHADAQALILFG